MQPDLPIGMRFAIISRAFKRNMDARVRTLGLTGVQCGVLGQLRRLEQGGNGEIHQRMLEEATHMSHPTMTDIIKRLEKNGFIQCRPSRADRRYKSISSTPRAEEVHKALQAFNEATFAQLSEGLSPAQVEALFSILDTMLHNACQCPCGLPEIQKGSDTL